MATAGGVEQFGSHYIHPAKTDVIRIGQANPRGGYSA